MGTNFYWLSKPDVCMPGEYLHIGKRTGAGDGLVAFMFQGVRETDAGPIDSWAKWRRLILAAGWVADEYGTIVDKAEFVAEVERTTPENRRRQYDAVMAEVDASGVYRGWLNVDDWLCADGFSFSFREFS